MCEGVVGLLESSYAAVEPDPSWSLGPLEFKVSRARQLRDGTAISSAGVTLLLYRVLPNATPRAPGGRIRPDGRREPTRLPLDLHFLLTAWADDAATQHAIVGWFMRVLEDHPSLPANILNLRWPEVFLPEESVGVVLADLTTEDLFRIWDTIVQNDYQISVPYVARPVYIDSERDGSGEPVGHRTFDVGYA